jgi:hypothetical protein
VTSAVDHDANGRSRYEHPHLDCDELEKTRRLQWPGRADGGDHYTYDEDGDSDPLRHEEPPREAAEGDRRQEEDREDRRSTVALGSWHGHGSNHDLDCPFYLAANQSGVTRGTG